jgi:hypothetical protein
MDIISNNQQILVLKGWEGFADRLQVLSHCMHYCLINDAAICVDWRDYMWGQEVLDFCDYFEILGIKTVTLNDVIFKIKDGASILPSCWTIDNITNIPNETNHFLNYNLEFNNYERVNSDIIVNNGKGQRTWHIDNLIQNLRLKKSISDQIIERIKLLELPFSIIHLRGTDRLINKSLEESIQPAINEINNKPPHILARMYLISDMHDMKNLWLSKFPKTKIVIPNYQISNLPQGTVGIHQLDKEVLDFYGVTKKELNIDALSDFITICLSSWNISNSSESLFTKMGIIMRQGGKMGICKWLHGFEPTHTPLPKIK